MKTQLDMKKIFGMKKCPFCYRTSDTERSVARKTQNERFNIFRADSLVHGRTQGIGMEEG